MNIYEKLAEARKIIRETKLKKAGHNSYSGYDYFTPEQVETLVADASEKTKTICITSLHHGQYGDFQELKFIDVEKPENKIDFVLATAMPEIQATNAAQQMGGMDTYSERYVKMKAFQIKDNNLDFDSQDNRVSAPTTAPRRSFFKPVEPKHRDVGKDSAEHDAASLVKEQ